MNAERKSAAFAPAFLLLFLAGCTDPSEPDLGPDEPDAPARPQPASLVRVSGDDQVAQPGSLLRDPLVVRAIDASGRPVAGATVRWEVLEGVGVLSSPSSVTDDEGEASVSYTLGPIVGQNRVRATLDKVTSVSFSAEAIGFLVVVSGDAQSAKPTHRLGDPLVVKVTGASRQPVAGVTVAWRVVRGDGVLSGASSVTDGQGEASVIHTLGPLPGPNVVQAGAWGLDPVTFSAEAFVGPPAALTSEAGNGQTARISQPLAEPLAVRVTDADGFGVPNADVSWSVTAGGGTLSEASTRTDILGRTSVRLTLGPDVGAQSVSASVSGVARAAAFELEGTQPVSVVVEMRDSAFVAPDGSDDLTILLGDTVRWVNTDPIADPHTATSYREPVDGEPFESGSLNPGGQFEFVPGVRGEWRYACQVHCTPEDAINGEGPCDARIAVR